MIGGNVSLYNESGGADIDPTPVLGVLGLVDLLVAPPPGVAWDEGDTLVLLGARVSHDGSFPLDGSRWATERRAHRSGDTAGHRSGSATRAVCAFVAGLVGAIVSGDAQPPLLNAVHDVSSGGWPSPSGKWRSPAVRAVRWRSTIPPSSSPSCLPASSWPRPCPTSCASGRRPSASRPTSLGRAGGDRVVVGDLLDLPLEALREAHEGNLAQLLGDS